jgi:hypothetical protein
LRAAVAASNSAASAGRPALTTKRRFQRVSSPSTRLILATSAPLLLYCAAYVGIFLWHGGVVDSPRLFKNEVLYAAQLEFSLLQTLMHVRAAAVEMAPDVIDSQFAEGRTQIINALRRLDWIAYGNAEEFRIAPMLQSGTALAGLLGGDACLGGYERCYTERACEGFRDAILWHSGLLGGIRDFRAAMLRMLDALGADPGYIYDMTSGDGGLVHSYRSTFLRPALREFSSQSRTIAQAQLQAFSTLNIVATALLVVMLGAVYAVIYKPRVRSTHHCCRKLHSAFVRMAPKTSPRPISLALPIVPRCAG